MNSKRILSALVCLFIMMTSCVPQNKTPETTHTDDTPSSSSVERVNADTSAKPESKGSDSSAAVSSNAVSRTAASSTPKDKKTSSDSSAASSKAAASKQDNTTSSTAPKSDGNGSPGGSPYRDESYIGYPVFSQSFYCVEDDEFLYINNMDQRSSPASITKLVTASVAVQYLSDDDYIQIGSEQYLINPGSSLCGLSVGTTLTFGELLYGLLVPSGADAAYAAAVNAARKAYPDENLTDRQALDKFVALMNDFAHSIGMNDSHFVSPEGWDYSEQYVTAHDLTMLGRHVLSEPRLRKVVGTYSHELAGTGLLWTSTNRLLNPNDIYYNKNAVGLKTGTTSSAGYCLLSAFSYNGKTYISAVLGAGYDRYELTLSKAAEFLGDDFRTKSKVESKTESRLESAAESRIENQTDNPDESDTVTETESNTEYYPEENTDSTEQPEITDRQSDNTPQNDEE